MNLLNIPRILLSLIFLSCPAISFASDCIQLKSFVDTFGKVQVQYATCNPTDRLKIHVERPGKIFDYEFKATQKSKEIKQFSLNMPSNEKAKLSLEQLDINNKVLERKEVALNFAEKSAEPHQEAKEEPVAEQKKESEFREELHVPEPGSVAYPPWIAASVGAGLANYSTSYASAASAGYFSAIHFQLAIEPELSSFGGNLKIISGLEDKNVAGGGRVSTSHFEASVHYRTHLTQQLQAGFRILVDQFNVTQLPNFLTFAFGNVTSVGGGLFATAQGERFRVQVGSDLGLSLKGNATLLNFYARPAYLLNKKCFIEAEYNIHRLTATFRNLGGSVTESQNAYLLSLGYLF